MTNKMNLPTLKCLRCGYEWVPRPLNDPRHCPKCSFHHWNSQKLSIRVEKGVYSRGRVVRQYKKDEATPFIWSRFVGGFVVELNLSLWCRSC